MYLVYYLFDILEQFLEEIYPQLNPDFLQDNLVNRE